MVRTGNTDDDKSDAGNEIFAKVRQPWLGLSFKNLFFNP